MQKGHKIKAKNQQRMVVLGKVTKLTLGGIGPGSEAGRARTVNV